MSIRAMNLKGGYLLPRFTENVTTVSLELIKY